MLLLITVSTNHTKYEQAKRKSHHKKYSTQSIIMKWHGFKGNIHEVTKIQTSNMWN